MQSTRDVEITSTREGMESQDSASHGILWMLKKNFDICVERCPDCRENVKYEHYNTTVGNRADVSVCLKTGWSSLAALHGGDVAH